MKTIIIFKLVFISLVSTDKISPSHYFSEIIKSKLYGKVITSKLMEEAKKIDLILTELKEEKKGKIENAYAGTLMKLTSIEEKEREKLKRTLENYIKKYPDSRMAPDLLLRLAEIYFEDSSIEFQNKMIEFQKRLEKGEEKLLPPVKDYTRSISIYKELLQKFPDHTDSDIVLYLLGYCWSEMGAEEEAIKYFKRLVNEKYRSPLYPETAFRLGEIYFNWNDFENAVYYYSLVENFPTSPFYDKSLYKLGWSYYRMNYFDNAINYFLKVIKYQEEHKVDVSLIEESKEYLAISIMEKMGIKKAEDYLRSQKGTEFAKNMLQRIARIYYERGQTEKALEVLKYFIEEYPADKNLFSVYENISKYYSEQDKLGELIEWKEKTVRVFLPDSMWFSKNKDLSKKKKSGIFQKIEKNIIELANYFYLKGNEATGSRSEKLYNKALEYYQLLIDYFPKSYFLPDAHFFRAEILFKTKNYLKASDEYYKTTEVKFVQNKYIQESAYNMIYSLDKFYNEFEPSGKELQNLLNLYKNRVLKYAGLFPFDPQTPSIMYRAGLLLMKNKLTADAIKIFNTIIDNYFTSELLDDAVKNVIKIYLDNEDYANLYKTGYEFLARPEIMTSELKAYITEIVGGSLFKSARQRESKEDYKGAIELYKEVINKFPDSEIAEKALYNISILYEKLNDLEKATAKINEFIRKYPGSELSKNAHFKLASLYDRVFDFRNALNQYLYVYNNFPKTKEAKNALFNLSQINYDLENYGEAARYFSIYIKKYPNDKESVKKFTLYLAECIDKINRPEEAFKIYSDYIRKYPDDLGNMVRIYQWMAGFYKKRQDEKSLKDTYSKLLQVYDRLNSSDKAKYASEAGEAKFYLVNLLYEEYKKIKLELPQKRMAKLLNKKAKLLEKLRRKLLEIPKIGDPNWTEASLYMIAKAYKDFSDALFNAPIPPELKSEEEKEIYKEQLELKAMPVEDKAIDAANKAIDFAEKVGIENEWVHKARLLLQKIKPDYEFERKRSDEKLVRAEDKIYYVYPDTTKEKSQFAKLRVRVKEKKSLIKPLTEGKINDFFKVVSSQDLSRFKVKYFIMNPLGR